MYLLTKLIEKCLQCWYTDFKARKYYDKINKHKEGVVNKFNFVESILETLSLLKKVHTCINPLKSSVMHYSIRSKQIFNLDYMTQVSIQKIELELKNIQSIYHNCNRD